MSSGKYDALIVVDGRSLPVDVRRSARSRRYRLTLDPAGSRLRLSLPARASLRPALAWAQQQEAWVRAQLVKAPEALSLGDGATFPFQGELVTIRWQQGASRTIRCEGGVLAVGGPADAIGPRVLRWLKARAREVLEAESLALAERETLPLASVSIGDPRSRWGSCSSSGAIRYSWRLILAPPWVRQATVAHELAHLLHMDHSPAFHAAHARLLGSDPAPARAWLRAHGAGLHRIGA